MKILKTTLGHSDQRGKFMEIINEAQHWKQMNHVITAKDAIRGNHYHKKTHELFYILTGKVHLHCQDLRTNMIQEKDFAAGEGFMVEPYEYHTVHALTDVEWIVLLSENYNPADSDIHKLDTAVLK